MKPLFECQWEPLCSACAQEGALKTFGPYTEDLLYNTWPCPPPTTSNKNPMENSESFFAVPPGLWDRLGEGRGAPLGKGSGTQMHCGFSTCPVLRTLDFKISKESSQEP